MGVAAIALGALGLSSSSIDLSWAQLGAVLAAVPVVLLAALPLSIRSTQVPNVISRGMLPQ